MFTKLPLPLLLLAFAAGTLLSSCGMKLHTALNTDDVYTTGSDWRMAAAEKAKKEDEKLAAQKKEEPKPIVKEEDNKEDIYNNDKTVSYAQRLGHFRNSNCNCDCNYSYGWNNGNYSTGYGYSYNYNSGWGYNRYNRWNYGYAYNTSNPTYNSTNGSNTGSTIVVKNTSEGNHGTVVTHARRDGVSSGQPGHTSTNPTFSLPKNTNPIPYKKEEKKEEALPTGQAGKTEVDKEVAVPSQATTAPKTDNGTVTTAPIENTSTNTSTQPETKTNNETVTTKPAEDEVVNVSVDIKVKNKTIKLGEKSGPGFLDLIFGNVDNASSGSRNTVSGGTSSEGSSRTYSHTESEQPSNRSSGWNTNTTRTQSSESSGSSSSHTSTSHRSEGNTSHTYTPNWGGGGHSSSSHSGGSVSGGVSHQRR